MCGAPRSDSWGAEQGSPRDVSTPGRALPYWPSRSPYWDRPSARSCSGRTQTPTPSSSSPSTVFLCMGAFCLIGWAVLYGRPFGLSRLRWVLLVLAVPSTLNGIRLAITGGPLVAYFSRGAALTLIVALQLLLLVDWTVRLRGMDPRIWSVRLSSGAATGAAAFLVALMIIPTVCALRWTTVIGDFRQTITQHRGVVPATDIPASPGSSYLWSWTNTTLSLILRSSSSNAVVENVGTTVDVRSTLTLRSGKSPPPTDGAGPRHERRAR